MVGSLFNHTLSGEDNFCHNYSGRDSLFSISFLVFLERHGGAVWHGSRGWTCRILRGDFQNNISAQRWIP